MGFFVLRATSMVFCTCVALCYIIVVLLPSLKLAVGKNAAENRPFRKGLSPKHPFFSGIYLVRLAEESSSG